MKYVSVDIETTGLDPVKNDVVEFAAILDDLQNPLPIEQLPRFHCYIIQDQYTGSPYALSMHPHIFRRIAERTQGFQYVYPQNLGKVFHEFLLKNGYKENEKGSVTINPAGKNFGTFDKPFLENRTGMTTKVRFAQRILDPAILYMRLDDEKLPDQTECIKRAGVTAEVTHNAMDDAMGVIQLIRAYFLKQVT